MRLPHRLLLALFLCLPIISQAQVNIGADTTICSGGLSYLLYANPRGGVWTGPTNPNPLPDSARILTSGGVLNPRPAAGSFLVTYTLGPFSATKRITIVDGPVANAGPDTLVCSGVESRVIGTPAVPGFRYRWFRSVNPVIPANGLNTDASAQPGVTLTNSDPQPAIVKYFLAVTDALGTCTSYDSVLVYVHKRTSGTIIMPRTDTIAICGTSDPFLLPRPTPPGGFWTGSGIAVPDRYIGLFSPTPALEGEVTLTYNVPCNAPATSATSIVRIRVPRATANPPVQVCANADSLLLTGFPSGGIWTGDGIRANGTLIPDPTFTGTKNYTYTVFAFPGRLTCTATDVTPVTFNPFPNVRPATDLTICSNADDKQLTGFSPAGGTFACRNCVPGNPRVAVNNGNTITPDKRNVGTWVIRYTVTEAGCSAFKESNVTVQPTDSAYAGRDTAICSNASPFNLTGYGPANGTWSGGGGRINATTGQVTPIRTLSGFFNAYYTVTSSNGCQSKDSLEIKYLIAPAIPNAGPDTAACANDPVFTLRRGTPAGGRWFCRGLRDTCGIDTLRGTFTPSTRLVGTNQVYYRVKSAEGCSARDSINIIIRSLPEARAVTDFNVCTGADSISIGSDTLPGRDGLRYTYLWTGNQGTTGFNRTTISNPKVKFESFDPRPVTRQYVYRVTRAEAGFPTCSNRDTLLVSIFPKPVATTRTLDNDKACEGDSITIRAVTNGRLRYQWYTRNTLFNPVPTSKDSIFVAKISGTYYLRVVDTVRARGVCSDTSEGDSIFIKRRNNPVISGKINFCANGVDSLKVTPSLRPTLSYQWLRENLPISGANDTTYNANIVANYRVLITDSRFGIVCYDTSQSVSVDSIPVPYNDLVRLSNDSSYNVCSRDIPFTLVGPRDTAYPTAFRYRWQNGSQSRFYTIDTTGVYFLSVYNECGNATDTLTVISILPTPEFTILANPLFKDTTVCKDIPFRLKGPAGNFYRWIIENPGLNGGTDSSQTTRFVDISTGDTSLFRRVTLRIVSPEGCTYEDTMRYAIEFCDPNLGIPTAFSPQNDDVNDFWKVRSYSVLSARAYVYDRWGQQVYYAPNIQQLNDNPWDGKYKGQLCLQGVYKYIIEYEGLAPNQVDVIKYKKTGTITLIR